MTDSRETFSWYVGEKHVGLDKKRQASHKEHVLSLQCLSQPSTSTRLQLSANFRLFAHSAVFSILVRLFRFFELDHGDISMV